MFTAIKFPASYSSVTTRAISILILLVLSSALFVACQGESGAEGAQSATGPAVSSANLEIGDRLLLDGDAISADLSGTGSATTISRSDHDHNDVYYDQSAVDGAIAAPSA